MTEIWADNMEMLSPKTQSTTPQSNISAAPIQPEESEISDDGGLPF
jgi:hypothetical protein